MPYDEFIRKLAHDYWNFDIIPLPEYLSDVANYIIQHLEEFKGAGPQ